MVRAKTYKCWIDERRQIFSFHPFDNSKVEEFQRLDEFKAFYQRLIHRGYRVM